LTVASWCARIRVKGLLPQKERMLKEGTGELGPATARLFRYGDVIAATAVIVVILLFIAHIPKFLLDILLVTNFAGSMVIMMVTMYVGHPLEFSAFPSMLLIVTLARLALNVAAAKLILTEANAGAVVAAFGDFVAGGNPVVGFVVFLIIIIIQFIVITNGANRVAEVAARFTLDAMPGRQMAIDADLNAGLITEEEARERRRDIAREADFYGAMDGAVKFVRGDAIAAIVIILIDVVGGFITGVWQKHMDLVAALNTYVLLTIGAGLVIQIPALLVSTASGLIVTRAESKRNMGEELLGQILVRAKPLFIAAVLLIVFGLIPGLPHVPFLLIGAAIGVMGYIMASAQRQAQARAEQEAAKPRTPAQAATPDQVMPLLRVDPVEFEIGYGLMPLVDPEQGGDLLDRVAAIRRQLAVETGVVIPPVRLRDNLQLRPNAYQVKIKGQPVAKGELHVDHFLAMDSGAAVEPIEGIKTKDPAFGTPATWITRAQKERAEALGYTVIDPGSVAATHLSETLRSHADEVLTRQDVQTLIDNLKETHPAVVDELIPNLMTLGEVQGVLSALLRERVSIRDLATILEVLSEVAPKSKDPDQLVGAVRARLARQITRQYEDSDGKVNVLTLDPRLESDLRQALVQGAGGSVLNIQPDVANKLIDEVKKQAERMVTLGAQPVLLCAQALRPALSRLLAAAFPKAAVLAYTEILPTANLFSVGSIKIASEVGQPT
jgi:flagellar biosynthesis protein FlhA